MNNKITEYKTSMIQDFESISKKPLKLDNLEKGIENLLENCKSKRHTFNFSISLSYLFKNKKQQKAFNKKTLHSILKFPNLSGKVYKVNAIFHDPENQLKYDSEFDINIFKDQNKKIIDILLMVKTVMAKVKLFAKYLGTKKIMPSLNSDTVMDSDIQAKEYLENLLQGKYRKTTISIDNSKQHIIFQGSFAACSLSIEHIVQNLMIVFDYLKNDLIKKITCDKINILSFNITTTRNKNKENNYDIL